MLTPKQFRLLGEILLQEAQTQIPNLASYVENAVQGRPTLIGEFFRISGSGRLDATRPNGPRVYAVRLQTRAVIRAVTRAAQAGIPVGSATKEWMQTALRATDFRAEAQKCLQVAARPVSGQP